MRILHRYLLKETLWLCLLGFVFFNLILLVGVIFELTKLIFIEGAPVLKVLELIGFSLPSFLNMVVPVSLLFAIVLTFSRLSADGEITAIRSSGVSLLWIEAPIMGVAVCLTILSLLFSAYLTPFCNEHYTRVYREILMEKPTVQVQEKTILTIDHRKAYVLDIERETGTVRGIILYEFPSSQMGALPDVVFAREGRIDSEEIILEDVKLVQLGKGGGLAEFGRFDKQVIYLHADAGEKERGAVSSWGMTFSEIRARLAEDDLSRGEALGLRIDFQGRIAIPLATFILAILAVPLGIKIKRGDKSISLGISLMAVVGYYVFYLAGTFLARAGLVPPLVGMWVPNFIIIASGLWLNIKMVRQ